jgi:hypothetical protein
MSLLKRVRHSDDAGVSMAELLVTMSVFSVVVAIFTTGLLQLYKAANKNEATITAQAQNNLAYLRLDKEVRYASGVSKPGTIGNDQYVEYLSTFSGTPTCTEIKLVKASGSLVKRSWKQGNTIGSQWEQLATGVTSDQAFTFYDADYIYNFQRLKLHITATSGTGKTAKTADTDLTFTALNTSLNTSSATVCTEGRSVA